MRGAEGGQLPWPLRRAAQRFDRWRRTRQRGTPIPSPLWTLAANLAGTYGVCKTACTLKLDYYSLKRRVQESTVPAVMARGQRPAFVELAGSTLVPSECVIDFQNSAGARMRMHLKGVTMPDLAALGRSFWSAE